MPLPVPGAPPARALCYTILSGLATDVIYVPYANLDLTNVHFRLWTRVVAALTSAELVTLVECPRQFKRGLTAFRFANSFATAEQGGEIVKACRN